MLVRDDLRVALVVVGTSVGAGLASGQEILQFFSRFGAKGIWGIGFCLLAYVIMSILTVNLCFRYRFRSYAEIIRFVCGDRLGAILEGALTLFIFGGNVVMIAGGGAMLNEYTGLHPLVGIGIMVVVSYLFARRSTDGVVAINALIVPMSTLSILTLGAAALLTLPKPLTFYPIPPTRGSWLMTAVLYSSFNMFGITGVLCPMFAEMRDRKQSLRGTKMGSFLLITLIAIIHFLILAYAPDTLGKEIPNLYVARQFGALLPIVISSAIWLEMLSTEIGDLYSLGKRIHHSVGIPYEAAVMLILAVSIPCALVGFSKLIRVLYPAYGAVSLVYTVAMFRKSIALRLAR